MARHARGWALRKRGDVYHARFSAGGRQHERSTGTGDLREARRTAERLHREAEAAASRPGGLRRGSPSSELEPLIALWLADVTRRRSAEWAATCEIYYQAHWSPRWSTIGQISSAAIADYIGARLELVAPSTVRHELSALGGFLRWCEARGLLGELPRWEAPKGKTDYRPALLTREQVALLLAELPDRAHHNKRLPVREYFTVMWATGWRRGTMARLRWSDVDWAAGTVHVRASADKKRFDREVPLTAEALRALDSICPKDAEGRRLGVGLVFGRRDFRHALRAAAVRALGEELGAKVHNHALRHGRLTDLASRSRNIAAIQYLAGHRRLESTMRYVHGALEGARGLLEEVGDELAPILGQDSRARAAGGASAAPGERRGRARGAEPDAG